MVIKKLKERIKSLNGNIKEEKIKRELEEIETINIELDHRVMCMQTRSSSRLVSNPSSNPTPSTNSIPKGRNRRRSKQRIEEFNLEELSPPIVTMVDQRTMAQLLQAPIKGYEDAIIVLAITADNFELKHGLLTLVQNKHNPSSNPTPSTNLNPKGRNRRRPKQRIENFNLEEVSPHIVMMADQRIMAQLLQTPTEGYEDAIVVPAITTENFELKHGLLTLVQNKQFFRHDKEDPHAHVRYFNKITSTLKFLNVLNTSIKLMLFPFSFEGAARIWLEKEPPRSIFTWDDLVSKFINQFFPPSKTTNLRNEITNFQQLFDKSFSEACDRFKDLLRACPHHGFSELHQLDTFYNALNSKDQDSFNSAAGGNFLDKMPRECLAIIESKSKVHYSCNKPVVAKKSQSPAPVKAVVESCVTCGGAHSYCNCPATDGNVYRNNIQEFVSQAFAVNYNQGNTSYRPPMMSNQIHPPGFPPVRNNQNIQRNNQNRFIPNENQGVSKEDFSAYVKANDAVMRNMQTQGQNMQNQLTNLTDLITKFVNSNSTFTSSSGTLPSNTIANPRSDLKAITTRSGVSYDGPQIPPSFSFLPKVMENKPEATKDTVNPTNNESTEDVQPQVVQSESLILTSEPVTSLIFEPVISSVSASKPNPKALIPYPLRRNDERNREKANNQIEKFYQIFKDMSFKISFADALILMPKFASTVKALIGNKEKLIEMARTLLNEHCSTVLLKKLPKKLGDTNKFLILCDFPELADHLISRPVGVVEDVYVKVGSFHCSADFVVVDFGADPRVPLILRRSFLKTGRALIDVFEGELTLHVVKEAITFNLDQNSRYSANYSDMTTKRIDVIDMACEEYSQKVLGFSDTISSGNPTPFYDLIVSTTSPTLTPFRNNDFLLEEVNAFLAIEDDPTSSEFYQPYLDLEGDILLSEAFHHPLHLKKIICLNMNTVPVNGYVQFRRTSLTGFLAQSIRSSYAIALDSPYLLVLITGTSQSRQHGFPFNTVNTKEYHSECSGNYHKDNA
nr:hypothetical protein [Tanacetum cinerariifolium]